MKAYRMSIECAETDEQKIEKMQYYTAGDLLYLLREIESHPRKYSEAIIKECASKLYNKNIICM